MALGTDFGTAPRRIGGTWFTRTGRQLNPAGQHYWDTQFRLGATDGQGHYKPEVGRQIRQARVGVTPAIRKQAGQTLGSFARSQQQQLESQAAMFRSFTPVGAAEAVVSGVRHGDPLGAGLGALGLIPSFGAARRAALAARLARGTRDVEKAGEAVGPGQEVLRATGAARRIRAEQSKLYSAERAARAAKLGPAFEAAGGGQAGHRAALAQLRGELPKLRFDQLTHLDDETIDRLFTVVQQHADLRPFEKLSLQEALLRVREGRVPRAFEIKLIERAFGPDAAAELAKTKPLSRKLLQGVGEVANLPRSILASADVSAPFRQGLLAGAANPRIFARNLGPMFRMLVSEKRYGQVMQEITERPSYGTMLDAKLKLTDLADMTTREEMFMSNLAEKITGGKYGIVRASSRAYVGFLNRMRADLFDHLVDVAHTQGIETPKLRRDVARFVNVATGRGELGPLEPAAVALNSVLFSPRLFFSRINALNPYFYATLDPFVRKQAVAAMAKLIGAGSTVLTLAWLAGARVNMNPRNADFGKLRVGKTRFDIWGGHQQLVRLFSQIASGEIVSSTTGKTLRLTGGHSLSRQDIIKRFVEGKLAPTPSLINDMLKGTDFQDRPFSWKRAVVSRSYPLLIQDALDIYHGTDSPWKALGGYGIGAFGVGVQTYGPPQKKTSSRLRPLEEQIDKAFQQKSIEEQIDAAFQRAP